MKKHWKTFLILGLVIVLIVAGVLIYQRISSQQQTSSLQTTVLARGTLTASIGATGTVEAKQQASLAFSITGRAEKINVKMGERVGAGQVLAELDPAYYPQQVLSAQIDLVNAQKNLDNLNSSQTVFAQAGLNLANTKQQLDTAQTKYNNTVEKYNEGWVKECETRANNAYFDYISYRYHNPGTPAAVRELQKRYQAYIDALRELEKAQEYFRLGVGNTAGGTKEAKLALEIAKAELDLAQAKYDDALAEFDRVKNGVPAQDLLAAQARVDAAQSILNQAKITAPFAGTILAVNLLPGDAVNPGTVVLIIADLSELHVDVPIAEVDYNRVILGQNAEMTLDAISDITYHGEVKEINLNATSTAGSVAYPVKVVISDADKKVLPGMTVAVQIEVAHLDNVLLVPNRAVRTVDGSRVVYLSVNGTLKAVKLELGASNDTMSEVLQGDLKPGDVVVLNPPTLFMNGSGGPMSGGGGGFFGQ